MFYFILGDGTKFHTKSLNIKNDSEGRQFEKNFITLWSKKGQTFQISMISTKRVKLFEKLSSTKIVI